MAKKSNLKQTGKTTKSKKVGFCQNLATVRNFFVEKPMKSLKLRIEYQKLQQALKRKATDRKEGKGGTKNDRKRKADSANSLLGHGRCGTVPSEALYQFDLNFQARLKNHFKNHPVQRVTKNAFQASVKLN